MINVTLETRTEFQLHYTIISKEPVENTSRRNISRSSEDQQHQLFGVCDSAPQLREWNKTH
jgi:hypothetical protein